MPAQHRRRTRRIKRRRKNRNLFTRKQNNIAYSLKGGDFMDWFRTLVTQSPSPPVNAMTKNDQDKDSMARPRYVARERNEAAREEAERVAAAAYRKAERAAAARAAAARAAAARDAAAAAERSEWKLVMPSTATKEGPGRRTQKNYKTEFSWHPKFDPYEDY